MGYSTKTKIEDKKVLKYNTGYMDSTFSKIELPYACKLLLQELGGMSLAPSLLSKKGASRWKYESDEILKKQESKLYTGDIQQDEQDGRYYKAVGSSFTKPARAFHVFLKRYLLSGSLSTIIQNLSFRYVCRSWW